MDRAIGLDVDDISDLVDLEERGDGGDAILAKRASEHIPSTAAVSLGIRHLYLSF